jgi:hypothetical protein
VSSMTNDPAVNGAARPEDMRRVKRQRVLKPGKIIFGISGATIDCFVRDESPQGVLVETDVLVAVPDQVTVKLPGTGTHLALRRWAMGNRIGFEFIGARVIDDETLVRMRAINEVLQRQGVTQAVNSLRLSRFFENDELRRLAEEAEAATIRLESFLLGK